MSLGSSVGSLGIGGFFCQPVNQGFSLKSSGLYAKIYGQCQPSSWLLWASLLWRHPACTGKGNYQCWNLSCWEDGSFRSRNQQEDQRSNCCLVARCRFYFCKYWPSKDKVGTHVWICVHVEAPIQRLYFVPGQSIGTKRPPEFVLRFWWARHVAGFIERLERWNQQDGLSWGMVCDCVLTKRILQSTVGLLFGPWLFPAQFGSKL